MSFTFGNMEGCVQCILKAQALLHVLVSLGLSLVTVGWDLCCPVLGLMASFDLVQ